MGLDGAKKTARGRIPQLHHTVPRAANDGTSVGVYRHRSYRLSMGLEGAEQTARDRIPQLHRTVPRAANDESVVGVHDYRHH